MPVIALTAVDDPGAEAKARAFGAQFFFHKPVDSQALLDAIAWVDGTDPESIARASRVRLGDPVAASFRQRRRARHGTAPSGTKVQLSRRPPALGSLREHGSRRALFRRLGTRNDVRTGVPHAGSS